VTELRDRARAALRALVGADADFRGDQFDAIRALVEERRRALVVQRTGWGKSAVYFVATKLLREQGAGPTLLISPLLSLMRNQIDAGQIGGVRAGRITSDNTEEWSRIVEALERDEIDLLLVAPERFANPRFRAETLPLIASRVGLVVIDEAHCISDWGHDFRPDYRRITSVLDLLPSGVPVLCTTATANDRVVEDIVDQLGHDLYVLRGPLDRESLALDVVQLPSPAERLAWLAETVPKLPGTGIVYTLTVEDARRVTGWLRRQGIDALAYFGDASTEDKVEIERQLQANELKCVVATSALGMGYDKPNLAFVVHFQVPGSAVAYYQQVGRAGRAIDQAFGIALAGREDRQIQDWFISTAFPPREHAEAVVANVSERGDWVKLAELERVVNLRRSRLTNMLKVLEVEGVVEREGQKWRRTSLPWEYPHARVEAVTARRHEEQDRMREFLEGPGCLMEFLRHELDDPQAARCGRCARCLGRELFPHTVDAALAREAAAFLRNQWLTIEPRKQWPDGSRIPANEQAEPARIIGVSGDGGWSQVAERERVSGQFGDDLVGALTEMTRGKRPDPLPTWVTCVPSLRRPDLVESLAARFAEHVRLPFRAVVAKTRDTAPQAEMSNSAQQYANIRDAFAISGPVPDGPVYLLDDFVDSRWTLTVVAALLRREGAGPVFPLALAQMRSE
jgi:ATP-dependent DNA helicase RecQ